MNNTITPRQVEAIQKKVDAIATKAKTEIEKSVADFYAQVSKQWADEEAANMAQKVARSMNSCIQTFEKNTNNLKQGVVSVANEYARQAHKPTMNASSISLHPAINPTVVKTTFEDGETYGLVSDASLDRVTDAWTELKSALGNVASEAREEYINCWCFGVDSIRQAVVKKGTEVYESVTGTVNAMEQAVNEEINKAKQGYNKVLDTGINALNSLKADVSDVEK